jgi:hypothetical protein
MAPPGEVFGGGTAMDQRLKSRFRGDVVGDFEKGRQ